MPQNLKCVGLDHTKWLDSDQSFTKTKYGNMDLSTQKTIGDRISRVVSRNEQIVQFCINKILKTCLEMQVSIVFSSNRFRILRETQNILRYESLHNFFFFFWNYHTKLYLSFVMHFYNNYGKFHVTRLNVTKKNFSMQKK